MYKVLFICSGNKKNGVGPIIKNQGDSLKKIGIEVEYFQIVGKGWIGYLKSISVFKKYLKSRSFDIIHAHYSLSAFVASLAGARPLVVSLMGSDVKSRGIYKVIIRFFSLFFAWKTVIVKSLDMKDDLNMKQAVVIPNGVDFMRFKPLDKMKCQKFVGWSEGKKHLLFAADPGRYEKNYPLTSEAIGMIDSLHLEVHYLTGVHNEDACVWYNASDVVILTSLWEGSPNVIKEAMACNRPVICTNVGDVQEIFGKCRGCFLVSFDAVDVAQKLQLALTYTDSEGRDRLTSLGLEAGIIADRIQQVYQHIE